MARKAFGFSSWVGAGRSLVASRIVTTRLNEGRVRLGAIVFLSALGFALLGTASYAQLAMSPWPMLGHDLNRTGRSPFDTSANTGVQKWKFKAGGIITSELAIGADGTIYVGSVDSLYAVTSRGTLKWRFTTGNLVVSSPAISADGTIYLGSYGDTGLYAVNPDGTQKWKSTVGVISFSSPVIGADGTIYVGSKDNNLYALNPDGTENWHFATGGAVDSSPAIGVDGTIYVGSVDHNLYALNPDGTEKWRFTTGSFVSFPPAIGADGTIYVGSFDNNLYAINPDGTENWQFPTGDSGSVFSPAIGADGTIYVGSWDWDSLYVHLHAVNADGTEKWKFTNDGGSQAGGTNLAIGADGTIYARSGHFLYALNPDGTQRWKIKANREGSGPAIGAGGTVYFGSSQGLYALGGTVVLQPSTLDFGTVKVGQSSAPSTVTLSNGTVQKLTISGKFIGMDYKIVSTTCSSVLKPGLSCNYMVSFRPLTAGTKNEMFRVFDNINSPQTVQLHGIGQR